MTNAELLRQVRELRAKIKGVQMKDLQPAPKRTLKELVAEAEELRKKWAIHREAQYNKALDDYQDQACKDAENDGIFG